MGVLRGRVETGVGDFARWIEKLNDHYHRITGLRLFPGTLNVRLEAPFHRPAKFLRLEKEDYGGTVSVSLIPCRIFGHKAFILRPDKAEFEAPDEEKRLIEVATDVKLRDAHGLMDGDWVEVELE